MQVLSLIHTLLRKLDGEKNGEIKLYRKSKTRRGVYIGQYKCEYIPVHVIDPVPVGRLKSRLIQQND
jgi:hypothetical protein